MTATDAWLTRRRARTELEGRLILYYFPRKIDEVVQERAAWVVDKLAAGGAGRMLVVTGETHAGKSSCVGRALSSDPFLARGDDPDEMPVLYVELFSLVNTLQLGREILHAAGYSLSGVVKEGIVWERVRQQLKLRKVKVLWIDEAQHTIFVPKDGKYVDVQYVEYMTNKFKGLMKQGHRMSVVLSGLVPFRQFVRLDGQVVKMAGFVDVERISDEDKQSLCDVIDVLASEANLDAAELNRDDLVPRLMHAADYAYGDALRLVVEAVLEAATPVGPAKSSPTPSRELRSEHFALAYGALRGSLLDGNPFVATNWSSLECSLRPADPEERKK